MDNPGALATLFTQDEDKQNKKAITQYKKKRWDTILCQKFKKADI